MFVNIDELKRGTETLDTKFSQILEANLFHKKIFVAGKTFSDRYMVDGAGQIVVRKLGKGTVDRTSSMKFEHAQTADTLIPIIFNEHFKKSEEIYEAVEIARGSKTAAQKMEVVVNTVSDEWQAVAHNKIAAEATALPNTTQITEETVKEQIINARKSSVDNKSTPDTLIVTTEVYAKLLGLSGKEFIPNSNEDLLRTGIVGSTYGMNVYESAQLADVKGTGEIVDEEPTDENIEFLLYNHLAYTALTQVIAVRVIDAGKDWVGSAAQVHLISGFKVTNPEMVFKKVYA